ncbi:MAG TPA: hypothetical protein PKY82_06130 [Pyrinomonadaceae bacterium]|nr:hypothetical protein [Pyrinomonadaceae bacterium]
MNQHLTINEIKSFAAGDLNYSKLLENAGHIFNCSNCLKILNEIDPYLLQEAHQMEAERNKVLNGNNHFSLKQINKYFQGKIKLTKRLEMAKHFRKCEKCASILKTIDPDYTRTLGDLKEVKLKKELIFEEKPVLFPKLKVLIPVSVLTLILSGVLGYIFFTTNQTINQAQLDEDELLNLPIKNSSNTKELVMDEKNTKKITISNNHSDNVTKTKRNTQSDSENLKRIIKNKTVENISNKARKENNIITSETRSTEKNNCLEGKIEVESPNGETITDREPILKWKPVQKVLNYQVYVYDEIQIPLTEAKNQKENFFKITKALELNKSYNWVVIANLEDGKTMSSGLVKFKVGNKATKRNKVKLNSNETRCLP